MWRGLARARPEASLPGAGTEACPGANCAEMLQILTFYFYLSLTQKPFEVEVTGSNAYRVHVEGKESRK